MWAKVYLLLSSPERGRKKGICRQSKGPQDTPQRKHRVLGISAWTLVFLPTVTTTQVLSLQWDQLSRYDVVLLSPCTRACEILRTRWCLIMEQVDVWTARKRAGPLLSETQHRRRSPWKIKSPRPPSHGGRHLLEPHRREKRKVCVTFYAFWGPCAHDHLQNNAECPLLSAQGDVSHPPTRRSPIIRARGHRQLWGNRGVRL